MPSFRPARCCLTVRALALGTVLFALDFSGIAWVARGQARNVRTFWMTEVDMDEQAWALDPVREVVRPIVWTALVLLAGGSILLYFPRPVDRVLVGIMAVVLLVG